jgi:hypothetical protein
MGEETVSRTQEISSKRKLPAFIIFLLPAVFPVEGGHAQEVNKAENRFALPTEANYSIARNNPLVFGDGTLRERREGGSPQKDPAPVTEVQGRRDFHLGPLDLHVGGPRTPSDGYYGQLNLRRDSVPPYAGMEIQVHLDGNTPIDSVLTESGGSQGAFAFVRARRGRRVETLAPSHPNPGATFETGLGLRF